MSKYDLVFRKGYKPQFTRQNFEIVAIATKNHQHTQTTMSDEQEDIIQGKFYQKVLIKVIQLWIRLQ